MKQFEKAELKSISALKLNNPNKFNATTAVIAFLVALIGAEVITLLVSPVMDAVINRWGIGLALCLSAIISQGFIFLVAFFFCKIKKVSLFGGGELNLRFNIAPCIPAILFSFGVMLLISPTHNYFADRITEVQNALFGNTALDSVANLKIWDAFFILFYAFILAPILPAIAEEALFRGVIMNGLREFGSFFAIILSGALFALMHGNYAQIILQFLLGCVIAFVVLINENYFMGIVMHFANNLFATLIGLTSGILSAISPLLWNLFEGLSIMAGLIMVCVAACYYYRLSVFKKRNDSASLKSFAFYRPDANPRPCCILRKGELISRRFFVDRRVVLSNDNTNFLFFTGGKFHKFAKGSNRVVFAILISVSLLLAVGVVILNFFPVG